MLSLRQPAIDVLTLRAPSGGVTADVPVVIGVLCVIPVSDVAEGELFAGHAIGVFELPKATGGANDFAAGEVVEWDVSAGKCIPVGGAAGDFELGVAEYAVGASDTTVRVIKVIATTEINT